jgi:basic amino acid/polyamine antiporter, APA family
MADTTSENVQATEVSGGLFVRNSTGLVREVSPASAVLLNMLPAVPGVGLAISVFWVLAVYPGAHILPAFLITGILGLCVALPFGLLSMIMPRSGADYILVSRSLGPAWGLSSSFTFFVSQMLGIAFIASTFVTVGLIPGLATIGLVSKNKTILDLSTTLSSKNWTFALSLAILVVALILSAMPLRSAFRVQNFSYVIAGAGLLLGAIVMLTVSKATFAQHFDQIAGAGSYQHVLKAGSSALGSNSGWGNTIPALGALSFVFLFSWWSTNFAGEIRKAKTWSNAGSMMIAIGALVVIFFLVTAALYKMAGGDFVAAANAVNGTPDYPLHVAPFWLVFVAIGAKSSLLAIILVVTFLFWFPMWTWMQIAQPVRALFAWSFDGLLPPVVASVDDRRHSPRVALAITAVLSVIALVWAVYSSNFFTVLALLVVLFLVPMAYVAVGAMLLPYLRPALFRQSPITGRFLGIPLLSWIGAFGLAASLFVFWIFMKYPALGVSNRKNTLIAMFGLMAGGFVLYYIARAVQRKRGVDIALNYQEIPPE